MARALKAAPLALASDPTTSTSTSTPGERTHGASEASVTSARLALASLTSAPEGKARGVYGSAAAASMAIIARATVKHPNVNADTARAILDRPCSPDAAAMVDAGSEAVSALADVLASEAAILGGEAGRMVRTSIAASRTVAGAIIRTERAGGSVQSMLDSGRTLAAAERSALEHVKAAAYRRPMYRGPK